MKKYRVFLKPFPEDKADPQNPCLSFTVKADEVNLETIEDGVVHYIFISQPEEEDAITVASIPFNNLRYLVMEQS